MPQDKVRARARARAIAIARGQYKPKPSDPKIWFPSMKSLAETLSDKNMELIKILAEQKRDSIAALSLKTGRASSNLSHTLNRLAIFGLVTLQKRPGNVVRPIAKAIKYNISMNPTSPRSVFTVDEIRFFFDGALILRPLPFCRAAKLCAVPIVRVHFPTAYGFSFRTRGAQETPSSIRPP